MSCFVISIFLSGIIFSSNSIGVVRAEVLSASSCIDLLSDCKHRKEYCSVPEYTELMFKFCKNTCDLCQNDPNEVIRKRFHDEPNAGIPEWHTANIQTTTKTTEITTSTSSCTDKYNTCEFSKPLCESKYKAIMEKRCPKTCGVC